MSSLRAEHRALIEASAISSEAAAARGYRTVETLAELGRLGFSRSQQRVPALLVPLWGPDGRNGGYQIRPNNPRTNEKGKPVKYETPAKFLMRLDISPLVQHLLTDPSVPLFITEGVRKGDAAASIGLCCIVLLGVWNWRGTNDQGGKMALADWSDVALNGRRVYLVFDSDAWENPNVHAALSALREWLKTKGAEARIIYLPPTEKGGKQGLDDYLAAGGTRESLLALASTELRAAPASSSSTDRRRVITSGKQHHAKLNAGLRALVEANDPPGYSFRTSRRCSCVLRPKVGARSSPSTCPRCGTPSLRRQTTSGRMKAGTCTR